MNEASKRNAAQSVFRSLNAANLARWCGYCQHSLEGCTCPPWMPNTGTDAERRERGERQANQISSPEIPDNSPAPRWCDFVSQERAKVLATVAPKDRP